MTKQKGKVYLVGAGPGDVRYLTVQAYHLLRVAEVLVYDALIDVKLLQLAPSHCLQVNVGKRGGQPSTSQAEINQLLIEYCYQGKQVIRLKSGDPFIFGRCRSELEALKAAACKVEVIPGISSALAAPLLAGIPLTDPIYSQCFAVFSAHEPDTLNWQALTHIDTLVMLMAGQHLSKVIDLLLENGRSPSTPIAIMRWAGTVKQRIWTGTLETIVQQISGTSLSPAVIVVGEVIELRRYLQPEKILLNDFLIVNALQARTMPTTQPPSSSSSHIPTVSSSQIPLSGKTILVTRAVGQSNQFTQLLNSLGANVIEMPALEIGPPSSWEALDQEITHISDYHWIILTSSNGVDYFFERLLAQGKDSRNLAKTKIAVVGEKTAQSLKRHSLQPDFIPPNFVADSLVANFPEDLTHKKILFPRVETGGREVLVQELTAKGADITEVPAYQSCCPQNIPPSAELALQSGIVDVITFASSKTVQFFSQLAERIYLEKFEYGQSSNIANYLEGVCIASIGPQTSKACRTVFGRVDIEAEEYTIDGLTQALVKWATNSQTS